MREYTIDELLSYREDIIKKAAHKSSELILNDSIMHAAMVFEQMLDIAGKNHRDFNVYCGSFSLLRDDTIDMIRNLRIDALQKANNEEDRKKWIDFRPEQDLLSSLRKFLSNNGNLNVIFQKPLRGNILKERIGEFLPCFIESGQVKLYVLEYDLGLDHFCYTTNAFRMENNDTNKTAICSFNDSVCVGTLKKTFSNLLELSRPVSLS